MPSKLLKQGQDKRPAAGLKKASDRADPADSPIGLVPLPRTAYEGAPGERLAVLEGIIGRAQDTADLTVRQARDRFIREAGPALAMVNDDDLWQGAYDNFVDYLRRRWGYSSTHGYLLVAHVGVQKALPEGARANTGHVQVLAPILRNKGTEAVREVWQKSEKKNGQPTAVTLQAAAQELGHNKKPSGQGPKKLVQQDAPRSAVGELENAVSLAQRHITKGLVKRATDEDPEAARRIAEAFTGWAQAVTRTATRREPSRST